MFKPKATRPRPRPTPLDQFRMREEIQRRIRNSYLDENNLTGLCDPDDPEIEYMR